MPTEITRRLEFDAGHRVVGHEGKCRNLHGHRYRAEITVQANGLDDIGRVIDFGVVKMLVGKWIDDNWDHNMLLNSEDPLFYLDAEADGSGELPETRSMVQLKVLLGREPYVFKNQNPTAEVMAAALFDIAVQLLKGHHALTVTRVRIYETPNCWADYE